MTGTPQNRAQWGRTVYGLRYAATPGARWGMAYTAGAKGSTSNAKSDTVFLSTPGSIETDASQQAQDMTLDAGAVKEAASTRTALDGSTGFEFAWLGTIDAAAGGEDLHYRGDGAGTDHFRVFLFGAGAVRILQIYDGTSNLAAVFVDGLAGVQDVGVQVSARPNPLTSGAADAIMYESAVVVDGVWFMGQVAGRAPSSTADTYVGGGRLSGGAIVDQPNSTTAVRVSERFHTMTEFGEDFIASRAAGGTAYEQRRQPLAAQAVDGIGAEGEWSGQAQYSAAAELGRNVDRRLFGPLWGEVFRIPAQRLAQPLDEWTKANALGDGHALFADLVRWVPVPPGATHISAQIHANNWAEVGGVADTSGARALSVKIYSLSTLPLPSLGDPKQLGGPAQAPVSASATLVIPAADNRPPLTAAGAWYNVGITRINRSTSASQAWSGTTFICAGIEDTSGTDEGRLQLNAIRVVPLTLAEFDEGEP